MAYNYERRHESIGRTRGIRIAELSHNLEIVRDQDANLDSQLEVQEDMRFFNHAGALWGVYFEGTVHDQEAGLVVVTFDENLQVVSRFEPTFGGRRRFEKNWQFFSHEGQLLCVYRIQPHVILRKEGNRMVKVSEGEWRGGFKPPLYGGTPALEFDGQYLSFFHYWVPWWWRGKSSWKFWIHPALSLLHASIGWPFRGAGTWPHRIYHAGAYTFEKAWPFRVQQYTPSPLISANTEDAPPGRPACVFPCGACWHDGQLLVSYGHHDERCLVAAYSPDVLRESLVTVS